MSCTELLGEKMNDFIAGQVTNANGEHPTERSIRLAVARCKDPSWYPGKSAAPRTGRKPVYSKFQVEKVAEVAMDLKRKRIAPTPRRVRQRLPGLTKNPETGRPMSDNKIQEIFSTKCYDEKEDDPWQYLDSGAQDTLPEELKPLRVASGQHILDHIPQAAWQNHVAIDPCYKLLPKKQERLEEQQVAAMGKKKWQSAGSRRMGVNLRAPSYAKTQGGSQVTRADWTPVFARGRLRIYVCDPAKAAADPRYPAKLSDSTNLAKFVKQVLPEILKEMQTTYKWPNIPKVIVHDKASYMVTYAHERLNVTFANALRSAGFLSWVGKDLESPTSWLVKKFGDVYLHETVNAHIHRLLDQDFACRRLHETVGEFKVRSKKVERYMNSKKFAKEGQGRGLLGLAKDLRARCKDLVKRQGERLPK